MVHLDRITTKTGDDGQTGLGDGSRISKTHPRIVAMGTVDELNAAIGVAIAERGESVCDRLRQIQNDLFDLGAELCLPEDESSRCRIETSKVERLERWTVQTTEQLQPLSSFILPGGSRLAADLHLARTICRRAERDVLLLAEAEPVSMVIRQYLNRLSDLLFVFARMANDGGRGDVLWHPGGDG